MARRFLYVVAACIVLVFAGRVALQFFPEAMTRAAFLPQGHFAPQPGADEARYADPAMWYAAGPGRAIAGGWLPEGASAPKPVRAAVFFVHPTTYFGRSQWNAPLDDPQPRRLARPVLRGLASPFSGAERIWAPRYRQATFGAFLSDAPDAEAALDLAYRDVAAAFAAFVQQVPADQPIVLVGHSQGAFLLRRLLAERIAGTALQPRIAAAYLVGWPLSPVHDLPQMGLPPCAAPGQARCILSWLSFGDPADPAMMLRAYARHRGLDGAVLGPGTVLCSNPLTGGIGGSAPASANRGALVPDVAMETGSLRPALAGAACRPDGLLALGTNPEMGPLVLPGNNYHTYDIPLFWANLRDDFTTRVATWTSHR